MTSKIGLFKSNLHDTYPRGARRAARAIVEIIDGSSVNNQTFICLEEKKIPNSRPLSFDYEPLNEWLKNNPLSKKGVSKYSLPLSAIKKLARLFIPPLFYPQNRHTWIVYSSTPFLNLLLYLFYFEYCFQ